MRRKMQVLLVLCMTIVTGLVSCASAKTLNVSHGSREEKRIAVTVDDCYDIDCVRAVLGLCERYDFVCTFFVIGSALKYKDADLWADALEWGCEIGNHTWSHKDLTEMCASDIRFQLLRTQQKLDQMLGYHYAMQVLRPPYGKRNHDVVSVAEANGYRAVVTWDVSQTTASKAIRQVQPGSVLLYHARRKDVTCLKKLVPALLKEGYSFVTVSDLFGFELAEVSEGVYSYAQNAVLMDAFDDDGL